MRIARKSGFRGLSYRGTTIVESHEWRRGRDIGKRRTTFGVYGTKAKIAEALTKAGAVDSTLRWNEFRNGNFMVW